MEDDPMVKWQAPSFGVLDVLSADAIGAWTLLARVARLLTHGCAAMRTHVSLHTSAVD